MPTLEDIRLGQLAASQGLCGPEEVEECLAEQREAELEGRPVQLGEILISRCFLTRTQLERLLSIQQEVVQRVTRIGPYDLIRKLGEGGMGTVYQTKDTRTGETVALKVLPRSKARDATFLERFEREVRANFDLDHPNIVRGLDVGNADGYHFLVMEYVRGGDVFEHLSRHGRFSEAEALNLAKQIAAALDHIHGERLVHRDIKPENILLTPDGTAKLADMGLALDDEVHGRSRITKTGTAMGTPYYLSPEQVRGDTEADIRSDIYSLGATVYEMVTGKPPFEGENPAVVMMKHLREQVPSPRDIDRTVSTAFCWLLERMMAKEPAERYADPAELLVDIERVIAGKTPLGKRPAAGRSSLARPSSTSDADNEEKTSRTGSRNKSRGGHKLKERPGSEKTVADETASKEWHKKMLILGGVAAVALILIFILIRNIWP